MRITTKLSFIAVGLLLLSCNRNTGVQRTDTTTSGYAELACDDCFSPIMDEEVSVFEGIHEDAHIKPFYTNEVEAINLFLKDSIRLVVAARDMTPEEKQYLKDKKLVPRSTKIAVDGIALIIHKKNRDSLITVNEFRDILAGKIKTWGQLRPGSGLGPIRVVFDNPNSSTVRYVQDSIYQGKINASNVFAKTSNKAVIDFVGKTPGAIGVIGVSWVCDRRDSTCMTFINNIRVMSVSAYDEARPDNSYLPYAAYLALGQYPLRRDIYMLISDVPGGLPSGFMNFVGGDNGQRVILKAGMVPATRPMRLVSVKEEW